MKRILRFLFPIALGFQLVPVSRLEAQFSSAITNPQISGNQGKLLGNAVLTVQSTGNFTAASGSTVNINGVFAGSPTGGTLSLANMTVTLPTSLVVAGANGGTGVANTGKTITLGGNLTTSGAYNATLTLTGATSVTLPTTGTLATLAGAESLLNKKLGSLTANGVVHTSSSDGTLSSAAVDVTTEVTGILPALNGGTGNGFTAFSGPATSTKTFTLPNATATILTDNAAVTAAQGGTGQTSYTKGDLLVATGATTLVKLAVGGNGTVLTADSAQTSGLAWGSAGSGTVTHTAGALTSNSVVLGAGSGDTKVVAGVTTDGTSALNLGVAGSSVGKVVFANGTSGTITMQPPTGALGTITLTVPATTDTLVGKTTTDTLTNKTLTAPAIGGAAPIITFIGSTSTNDSNLTLQPTASNTPGQVNIAPSGTSTDAILMMHASSALDSSGGQKFGFGSGFAGAVAGSWNFGAFAYSQPTTDSLNISFVTSGSGGRKEVLRLKKSTYDVAFPQYGAGTLITNSSGDITASSDARLKTVRGDFERGLFSVLRLRPALYSWKREESPSHIAPVYPGFIAQEVQRAIPEAVGVQPDGMLTLQDRGLIGALVNAVKTLTWLVSAALGLCLLNLYLRFRR